MQDKDFYELVEQARHADLVDYFRTSGYTLKKISGEIYINEIKGLSIKPETNSWFSHYNQVGRVNNSLDCLTLILDKSFKDAVYELTGQDVSRTRTSNSSSKNTSPPVRQAVVAQEDKEKRAMEMPAHAPTQRRVFAYFHSTRKIPNEVIRELVDQKLLYQAEFEIRGKLQDNEQIFKKSNAVFIHTDNNGKVVGGEIQGLDMNKRFKGTVAGSLYR